MINQKRLDKLANLWNKTKDSKYKDLWYQLVEETYGSNHTERRTLPTYSSYEGSNGGHRVIH